MKNSIEFEARVRQLAAEKKEARRKRISFFTTLSTAVCACVVTLFMLVNNHFVNNVKSNNAVYEDYENSGLDKNDGSNMKENLNDGSAMKENLNDGSAMKGDNEENKAGAENKEETEDEEETGTDGSEMPDNN